MAWRALPLMAFLLLGVAFPEPAEASCYSNCKGCFFDEFGGPSCGDGGTWGACSCRPSYILGGCFMSGSCVICEPPFCYVAMGVPTKARPCQPAAVIQRTVDLRRPYRPFVKFSWNVPAFRTSVRSLAANRT